MNSPLVSIIIPTFNRANLLKIALDSVNLQSEKNYEIIVIDDGSTDATEDIIKSHGPINYLKTAGSGPAKARNIGISAAMGEFVAFLDSDDRWDPGILKELLEEFQKFPDSIMVYTNFRIINADGEIIQEQAVNPVSLDLSLVSSVRMIIEGVLPPRTSSVMVRRRIFDKIGSFDETYRIGEDFDMWIRISLSGQVRFINKQLMSYRIHDAHLSQSPRSEVWRPFIDIIQKHKKALLDKGMSPNQYICKFSLLTGGALLLENQRSRALKYYFSALINFPLNIKAYIGLLICALPYGFIKDQFNRRQNNRNNQSALKGYY